jgi:hypothetical protein
VGSVLIRTLPLCATNSTGGGNCDRHRTPCYIEDSYSDGTRRLVAAAMLDVRNDVCILDARRSVPNHRGGNASGRTRQACPAAARGRPEYLERRRPIPTGLTGLPFAEDSAQLLPNRRSRGGYALLRITIVNPSIDEAISSYKSLPVFKTALAKYAVAMATLPKNRTLIDSGCSC